MTRTRNQRPSLAPTWCSSDKDFVTTSLGRSRLWATIGHGVINEVYWPSTGEPELRDLTFYLVGRNGWVDLKRTRAYRLRGGWPESVTRRMRWWVSRCPAAGASRVSDALSLVREFSP